MAQNQKIMSYMYLPIIIITVPVISHNYLYHNKQLKKNSTNSLTTIYSQSTFILYSDTHTLYKHRMKR